MPPPSTGIPLPTGTLDSYRSALKAMQKESKAVTQQMAKDAKKGVEISKDLLDRKKAIDKAIQAQQNKLGQIDMMQKRQTINATAANSRMDRSSFKTWEKSAQGVMLLRHVVNEVKRLPEIAKLLKPGGPAIDKEQGASELLGLASHAPGWIGIVAKVLHASLIVTMAVQKDMKEHRQMLAEAHNLMHGGKPYEDPDEIERRNADPLLKKMTYQDPLYALRGIQASEQLGGPQGDEVSEAA